jgi:hypothetical protein
MAKNVLFFHHQIAGRKEEVQRTCQCSLRLTEKCDRVLKKSFNYLDNMKLCLEAKTNKRNLNICLELLLCFSHSLDLLLF